MIQTVDPELEAFFANMPPECAAVARRFPPTRCYRHQTQPAAHYWIYSFSEGPPVTCTIIHGRDSFAPGHYVFGCDPEQLVACDCGKWEPPTEAQQKALADYIATLDPRRGRRD